MGDPCMLVYPARHLFEAKFPQLEDHEEEVFFQHPVHAIKCNQIGILYFDENIYTFYEKSGFSVVRKIETATTPRVTLGTKQRVIWECYMGRIVVSPHFLYANGNPLDLRFDNMKVVTDLPRKEWAVYQETRRKFIKASVDHLMKLEVRMEKMGMSKDELYTFLLLPNWLMAARQKLDGPAKKYFRLDGTRIRTTPEQADEVERMYKEGMTMYAIIKVMGWTTNQRVKKVVKDRGLSR